MNARIKSLTPMVLTCLIAGVILTILAPYGTGQFTLWPRAAYWIGLCLIGGFAIALMDFIIKRAAINFRPFTLALIHSLASSLAVFGALTGLMPATGSTPGIQYFGGLFFYVWVIAFTISLVGMFMSKGNHTKPATAPARPVLYDRLKPALRNAEIYALSAEDHYVRVMTSKGDDLILMRLSDAIKEVAPLSGLSPHRSWWVAESGVQSVKKSEGKLSLLLNNDVTAPVSRNAAKAVREAGWV